ncbi:MAG: alpha/beta fold hydrolase [Nocardioides sp.]|nr:alpha/beta fold hydrolase [Nocardioides sp.]
MHAPSLTRLDLPGGARPRGLVLVLHGGKPHSMAPVDARSLEVPVVLLGHSMGARTAVQVADDPQVRGVVALAPWFESHDAVDALRDRTLAAAHGRTDKITSARRTQDFCRRAEGLARQVDFHDMGRVGHYMMRRVETWNDFALSRSLVALAD